jgi:hypothetical protein
LRDGGCGSIRGECALGIHSPADANVPSRYGTAYLFLQLIPGLSMFFLLTAAVSAALWAADLESKRREQESSAVQAPAYTDQPAEDQV